MDFGEANYLLAGWVAVITFMALVFLPAKLVNAKPTQFRND